MVWVYAIASLVKNYIYVGMTINLDDRFSRHNQGRERTTKPYKPFVLIYSEKCIDRIEGRSREKYWKSGAGKEKLRLMRDQFFPKPE
jgi:putative endonuclease